MVVDSPPCRAAVRTHRQFRLPFGRTALFSAALFVQEDVAERVRGCCAGRWRNCGSAILGSATDVGPVIDRAAQSAIAVHVEGPWRIIAELARPKAAPSSPGGDPRALVAAIEREVFGPVRMWPLPRRDLGAVLDAVNDRIRADLQAAHRIDDRVQMVVDRIQP